VILNASTLVCLSQSSSAPAGRALARLVGCQLSRKAPVKQFAGAQLSVFSIFFSTASLPPFLFSFAFSSFKHGRCLYKKGKSLARFRIRPVLLRQRAPSARIGTERVRVCKFCKTCQQLASNCFAKLANFYVSQLRSLLPMEVADVVSGPFSCASAPDGSWHFRFSSKTVYLNIAFHLAYLYELRRLGAPSCWPVKRRAAGLGEPTRIVTDSPMRV